MKEVHVISIIGFIYAVILSLITLIFFPDYTLWAVLGATTALFNHSLMIQVTKGKFNPQRYVFHLVQRYVFYLIIVAFTYLETKDLPGNQMIYSFVFLLLGIFSLKIGILIYHTPLIKKPLVKEENDDTSHNELPL